MIRSILSFLVLIAASSALQCREGYSSKSVFVTDEYKIVDCPDTMENPMCLTIQAESYNSWGQHVTVDYYTCHDKSRCNDVTCTELQEFINIYRDDVTVKDCKAPKCCDESKCNNKSYEDLGHGGKQEL